MARTKKGKGKRNINAAVQKANRLHTLRNKIVKLERQLSHSPTDISADIALSQAKYNLRINVY